MAACRTPKLSLCLCCCSTCLVWQLPTTLSPQNKYLHFKKKADVKYVARFPLQHPFSYLYSLVEDAKASHHSGWPLNTSTTTPTFIVPYIPRTNNYTDLSLVLRFDCLHSPLYSRRFSVPKHPRNGLNLSILGTVSKTSK